MLSGLKNILRSTPLFLVLVPIYVLLHLEKVFHQLINYEFASVQIIIMTIAAIILVVIGRLLSQNKRKAALITFILMLCWFYLGILKNYLEENFPLTFFRSYSFLLPASIAIILFTCYRIIKSKTSFDRAFLFINFLWIIFIMMDSISILSQNMNRQDLRKKYAVNPTKYTSAASLPTDLSTTPFSLQPNSNAIASKQPDSNSTADYIQPDIYYVIFDSYSGSTVLNKMGYNNTAIEDSLRNKGFQIVKNSTSNYNLTSFSIGSTLSMKYIDADTVNKYHLDDYLPAANVIKYNGLVPWLESQGYSINNFSFFDLDQHPALIPSGGFWDIEDIYLQQNAGLKVYKDLSWNFNLPPLINAEKIQRDIDKRDAYDDSVYASLLTIARKPGTSPRFVYAHFFMPHIPNSHDSNGNKIPVNTKLTVEEEMLGYIREIKFVNKRINTIATMILGHSKRPLVVIFQGDHGYRFYNNSKKADEFPNFCAMYFSNRDYRHVPDSLSNVNLFKAVLNTWFSQRIPFDPNRHFFLNYH